MSETLRDSEQLIYNLIQEYLQNYRIVEQNKLLHYLTSILSKKGSNLNCNGIKQNIESLIQKKMIFDGSRLSYDNVLENVKRKEIYQYIQTNPGVYLNNIIKDTDYANHIVLWHLDMLQKFSYIKTIDYDNHQLYFASNYDSKHAIRGYIMRNEKSQKIIEFLKTNNEGYSKTQLSKILTMHPNTIKKYLDELCKVGIVIKKQIASRNLYLLNNTINNINIKKE